MVYLDFTTIGYKLKNLESLLVTPRILLHCSVDYFIGDEYTFHLSDSSASDLDEQIQKKLNYCANEKTELIYSDGFISIFTGAYSSHTYNVNLNLLFLQHPFPITVPHYQELWVDSPYNITNNPNTFFQISIAMITELYTTGSISSCFSRFSDSSNK